MGQLAHFAAWRTRPERTRNAHTLTRRKG